MVWKWASASAAVVAVARAASLTKPGTSSGQRERPMAWTTAAAMPVGTASRIHRSVRSLPIPTAIGPNRAADKARMANHIETLV